MKIILSLLISLISLAAHTNNIPYDYTGKGVIILNDETVLFGEIGYTQQHALVTVKRDEKTLTYSAQQVKLFQFYDQKHALNRIFTSIVEESRRTRLSNFKNKGFLEMVIVADVMILRKEKKIIIEQVSQSERGATLARNLSSNPVEAIGYDYYFSTKGQTAMLIKDFTKQVVPHLSLACQLQIEEFIKDGKMNLRKWKNQYKILQHYTCLTPIQTASL